MDKYALFHKLTTSLDMRPISLMRFDHSPTVVVVVAGTFAAGVDDVAAAAVAFVASCSAVLGFSGVFDVLVVFDAVIAADTAT